MIKSALSIECAELLEITQWKRDQELEADLNDQIVRSEFEGEIADILIYLLLICDKNGLDPIVAAQKKLTLNEKRYPVDKARGTASKYSELRDR